MPNVPQTLRSDHTDAVQNDVGPAIGAAALRTMHEGNGTYAHNAYTERNNPLRQRLPAVSGGLSVQQEEILANTQRLLIHFGNRRTSLSGLMPPSHLAQALQVPPVIQNLRRPDL